MSLRTAAYRRQRRSPTDSAFVEYLAVREGVAFLGAILIWGCVAASVVLAAASLSRGRQDRLRKASAWTVGAVLLAGFLLLAYFHLEIYLLLPLVNPFDGSVLGSYKIPPWIESEKLLFWALLYSVMALMINVRRRRHRRLVIGVNLLLAAIVLLTAIASNPFTPPLPGFHSELIAYREAIATTDPGVIGRALGAAAGKMFGFYNSVYMWIHPPLLFASYAAFGVTFVGCALMFRSRERILDRTAYDYGRFGFVALTLGLLLGYPWALLAWKDLSWWWDPKINMALMMWVLFGAYLHARLYKHRRRMWMLAGVLGTASFVALVATYLSTYVIPGIHSVAG